MANVFAEVALMLFRWRTTIFRYTRSMMSTSAMFATVKEDLCMNASSLLPQMNTALDLENVPVGCTQPRLFLVCI